MTKLQYTQQCALSIFQIIVCESDKICIYTKKSHMQIAYLGKHEDQHARNDVNN